MPLDPELFTHDSDRAALQALKAIPGFTQLLKAYMNIWNERQYRIENMSSNLRISDRQMKKYHDMLPPICEKLGIDVPDMYMKLDVYPNAYTYGDTNPFIVLTSGLFEVVPERLIPTVLAHECGHIVCHHTMFRTMGYLILSNTVNFPLLTVPLKVAFAYWMRCSEFSADRAAAVYDGSDDKTIELCMRLSGYDKDLDATADVNAFLEQAVEYKQMVSDSKFNKTLEFLMYNQIQHPLNAVRAYELRQWTGSPQFQRLSSYVEAMHTGASQPQHLPMPLSAKDFVGKNYLQAEQQLRAAGFTNVALFKKTEKGLLTKPGQILRITANGDDSFEKGAWFPADTAIQILYYDAPTPEEIAAAHPGQIKVPDGAKKYVGMDWQQAVTELTDAGFTQVSASGQTVKKGLFTKQGAVSRITINGQSHFDKDSWFAPDALVRITYNVIAPD